MQALKSIQKSALNRCVNRKPNVAVVTAVAVMADAAVKAAINGAAAVAKMAINAATRVAVKAVMAIAAGMVTVAMAAASQRQRAPRVLRHSLHRAVAIRM